MRRLVTLAWVLVPVAAMAAGESATCRLAGSLHFTPPLTLSPQPITFTFEENWTCRRDDLSEVVGHLAGDGAGMLSCAGGTVAGTARIDWADGTYSAFTYEGPSPPAAGPLAYADGHFYEGTAYEGSDLTVVGLFHAGDAGAACASSGLADVDVDAAASIH